MAGGAPDLVGKEIAGRYRIIKKLGEGGMGAVYRGEQISLKRAVAVKLLRPELGNNQMVLRRFNAEAEAVAKLSHPNTVNIYDFGQDSDGSLFIAMEFIEGRSLREAIQKEGPFSLPRALSIAQQVAASLSDAHAHSIVHRDLKPDNVMLQDRGKQKDVVRVLDFGIAKLRDDNRATQAAMTQAGDMLGTPQYMAPEQIKGESIDGRTDIYALGCMIYEMVTARLPYEAPTIMAMLSKHLMEDPVPPTQRRPDLGLPPAVDHLVATAMAKEPAQRPATMEHFAELLGSMLQQTTGADANRSGGMLPPMGPGPAMTPPGGGYPTPSMPPPGMPDPRMTPPPYGGYPGGPPSAGGYPGGPPSAGGYPTPGGPPGPYMPGAAGAPYSPHGYAPAPPTAVVERPRSKAPLFAVIGVLVLGGGGVAAWQLTKKKDDTGSGKGSGSQHIVDTEPTPPPTPDPVKTDPDDDRDDDDHDDDVPGPKVDPWADPSDPGGTAAAKPAPKPSTGITTALMAIPRGAYLIAPPGFTKVTDDANTKGYINASRGLAIGMASLYAGSNDPDDIADKYVDETGVTFVQKTNGFSAGQSRPVLIFSTEVNGVAVLQTAVLYISPKYRLAVLYQAPVTMWQDEAFQKEVDAFFINNIKLPK